MNRLRTIATIVALGSASVCAASALVIYIDANKGKL